MPNIKPVSDLRNYGEVLRDVAVGRPVFLTRNDHGRYAILDMEEYQEYERMKRKLKKAVVSERRDVWHRKKPKETKPESVTTTKTNNSPYAKGAALWLHNRFTNSTRNCWIMSRKSGGGFRFPAISRLPDWAIS